MGACDAWSLQNLPADTRRGSVAAFQRAYPELVQHSISTMTHLDSTKRWMAPIS